MRRRSYRATGLLTALAILSSACGQAVLVREIDQPVAAGAPGTDTSTDDTTTTLDTTAAPNDEATTATGGPATTGSAPSASTDGSTHTTTTGSDTSERTPAEPVAEEDRCADRAAGPGVDADEIRIGTILPLSGPTRPLGEQTARVMQRAVAYYNSQTTDPTRPDLDWGCPGRKGIYGREVKLEIASISSDSEEDVLQAMRRLIDVQDVFMVRDCYLQASLMGPAHAYAESNAVTTYQCYPESLPQPQLAPHTFAPGSAGTTLAGLLTGHLVNDLGRKRIGLLFDPTYESQADAVRSVAAHLGAEIVVEVEARAQTAVNGRRSEVLTLRNANPDAVIVLDALNATYAGVAAGQLQWRPADSGVAWACNKCWLKFQVDVCGENCEGMITGTAGVPFRPYEAGSQRLHDAKDQLFPNEPDDILTFAALLLTAGMFINMAEVGPDLTRARFEAVLESLSGSPGSGLPPINTSPTDHFGGKSEWLIGFSGKPWPNGFIDLSNGFLNLDDVGVDPAWVNES